MLTNSKTLKGDLLKAKTRAMVWYVDNLIMEHFAYPNPNMKYKYKPNTERYEAWKRKYHPEAVNQLVLSGRLKRAVQRAVVDQQTGKVQVSVPEYGLYQMYIHKRDFLSPNRSDLLKINKQIKRNLYIIRSQRARYYARQRNM